MVSVSNKLYYQGEWVGGEGLVFQSENPALGEMFWEGTCASPAQVDKAYTVAQSALPQWSGLSVDERILFLRKAQDVFKAHESEMATLISEETGKALWETTLEAKGLVSKIELSIQAYAERCPSRVVMTGDKEVSYAHKPHGVLTVFGPFNFPAHLPNGHIMPALLAGNCIVFKPSELTPAVGAFYIELLDKVGFPPGVIGLLQGQKDVGALMAQHPKSQGLLFTGSVGTGQFLAKLFGDTPSKMLALELGGNNPLVVSSFADIEAAVVTVVLSAFITSGQRCTCARRLILTRTSENEALLKRLVEVVSALTVGLDQASPFYGTLISEDSVTRGLSIQEELLSVGATSLLSLSRVEGAGAVVTPGIIDVTGVQVPDDEYFGPLLKVRWVDSFDAAIFAANETDFGLSASLLSEDRLEFDRFYNGVKAGVINWNAPTTGASSAAPFGGVGSSGNHRPSAYYAADYCAYPVTTTRQKVLSLPSLPPGLTL